MGAILNSVDAEVGEVFYTIGNLSLGERVEFGVNLNGGGSTLSANDILDLADGWAQDLRTQLTGTVWTTGTTTIIRAFTSIPNGVDANYLP